VKYFTCHILGGGVKENTSQDENLRKIYPLMGKNASFFVKSTGNLKSFQGDAVRLDYLKKIW
jgi:hypothetical protein